MIFKYKGAEYSKNEYFFGIKNEQTSKKTAYQMFLEDDGPYSRKLFGPLTQKQENQNETKLSFKNFVYKSKRHFTLVSKILYWRNVEKYLLLHATAGCCCLLVRMLGCCLLEGN